MDEYEQDLRVLEEKHQQGLYLVPLHAMIVYIT